MGNKKINWPKPKNEEDARWIYGYIAKRHPALVSDAFSDRDIPTTDSEILQVILEFILEKWHVPLQENLHHKLSNAWNSRKRRIRNRGKIKSLTVELDAEAHKKLMLMAKEHNVTIAQVINDFALRDGELLKQAIDEKKEATRELREEKKELERGLVKRHF